MATRASFYKMYQPNTRNLTAAEMHFFLLIARERLCARQTTTHTPRNTQRIYIAVAMYIKITTKMGFACSLITQAYIKNAHFMRCVFSTAELEKVKKNFMQQLFLNEFLHFSQRFIYFKNDISS